MKLKKFNSMDKQEFNQRCYDVVQERNEVVYYSGCPCVYLDKPCHPGCTCRNGFSSTGCFYCCRYGSMDQRKKQAERLSGIYFYITGNK